MNIIFYDYLHLNICAKNHLVFWTKNSNQTFLTVFQNLTYKIIRNFFRLFFFRNPLKKSSLHTFLGIKLPLHIPQKYLHFRTFFKCSFTTKKYLIIFLGVEF